MKLGAVPPSSGAVVMGTGIVSVGLALDHYETLSRILLAIGCAIWLLLGLVLVARAFRDRRRLRREAGSPAALTGVAGTAVLGARLAVPGWAWAGVSMLIVASLLWLMLLSPVLKAWSTPTVGISLMVTISTESLAVLCATVATLEHEPWLFYVAIAPFLLGLVLYAYVISRFDLRQLLTSAGDHWTTGGALAISALAAGRISLTAHSLHQLSGLSGTLMTASLVLWALTICWLPVLLAAEVLHPRLRYDLRRWSTVFPVGMYAACSFMVGSAANASGITDFARAWIWVGVAVWILVVVGMLRSGTRTILA